MKLKPGEGIPHNDLNEIPKCWYGGKIENNIPKEFIKKLRKNFEKIVDNKEYDMQFREDGIIKINEVYGWLDRAITDTLLEE